MSISEIIGLAVSGFGVCFGFGVQHNRIATLKKDVDNMARLDRELLNGQTEMRERLIKIESDIGYLKSK